MKKLTSILLFLGLYAFPCSDLLDTDVKILNEKNFKNLCEYNNHTILVVNTASKCGFTYQYEQLESLQRRFKDHGSWARINIHTFDIDEWERQQ